MIIIYISISKYTLASTIILISYFITENIFFNLILYAYDLYEWLIGIGCYINIFSIIFILLSLLRNILK